MPKLTAGEMQAKISELEVQLAMSERAVEQYREELTKANQRLEAMIAQVRQELKMVLAVHKALVPTELPHIPGFEFSTKFVASPVSGGDYFDIFGHHDRMRFGLAIASSSGHALSALLLSVLLKHTGPLAAESGSDPALIVERIRSEMATQMPSESQADLFFALVDRRRYELSYCRLGEVVALLYQSGSGKLEVLESTGPALSANSSPIVSGRTLTLNPRDKLLLCSRGLVEARNLQGEPFGLERLTRTALESIRKGVHELRHDLFFEVQRFSGGQSVPRDQTAVILDVKDKVIKLAKT